MNYRNMEELKDNFCDALGKMSSEELTQTVLDNAFKLSATCFFMDGIMEGGSEGYSMDNGGSYARGRGRYARRDSRGRYSNEGGYSRDGYSREGYTRDGYSRGGYSGEEYSRDGYSGDMMMELQEMMNEAPDDRTRQALQQAIKQMK